MLKRIFFVIAASLLMLGVFGCACSNGTAAPSPTASMKPVSTPEIMRTPEASASTSPDAGSSASPDAGTGTGTGTSIPNFKEGAEVKPEEAPEIKAAVEAKYSGAVIKTIRHATQNGQQVYEVEIEQNGKTETIYVQPDGTILPAGTVNP